MKYREEGAFLPFITVTVALVTHDPDFVPNRLDLFLNIQPYKYQALN